MTLPEAKFHGLVAAWLLDSFQDVDHEVTLESGRRVDFVAHTPFESYVIEVENGVDSLYNALGQAEVYSEETDYEPVVVFPADDAPPADVVPDHIHLVTV